jgi:molecular chaperone GrpE
MAYESCDFTQDQAMNANDTEAQEPTPPEDGQPSEGAKSAESTASDTELERERLQQEVADLKDRYLRVMAEMDNMRRRTERERAELVKFGLENVFRDFLPVIDSLELALPEGDAAPVGGAPSSSSSYYDGMLMVKKQLLETLKRHGLEPVAARGVPFDPNLHQAIQRVESPDVSVETVGDEYARGYLLNGRLLRPAMVSVLTPSSAN